MKDIITNTSLTEIKQKATELWHEYKAAAKTFKDPIYADLQKIYNQVYNAHINSLRTISCHPSAQTVWKEGDVLTEGVDYEIRQIPCPYFDHIDDPVEYSDEAFPLVPVKSEEELWRDALDMSDSGYTIADLQNKYIITKR